MAQYTIQSPSGKQVTLEGDVPPSEADLNQVFGQLGDTQASAPASSKSLKYSDMEAPKNQGTTLGIGEVVPGVARGVVQGGQEMLNTLANVNEIVGSPAGTAPRDLVNASRKALDQLIPPSQSVTGKIAEGLGQLPSMATTYGLLPENAVLPVAGALGAINSHQDGVQGALKGAAGNMLVMALLKHAQGMNDPLKAAALGAATTGGATAISGGEGKDVIAQAALGAGFSLYPPEQQAKLQKDFQLAKQFIADPKGNAKAIFDVVKEDPVQRNMRIAAQKETQLKMDLAERNNDLSTAQRQAIENAKNLTSEDLKAVEASKTAEQKRADAEKKQIEQNRAIEVTRLQNQADQFESSMPQTAYEKAKYIQNKIKPFFGQATEGYGKQLDATVSKIGDISKENAFGILGSALDKSINDYKSSDTSFAKNITKLQAKYNPEGTGELSPGIQQLRDAITQHMVGKTPEQIAQIKAENPQVFGSQASNQPVKFKDFYSDVKNILDKMDPSEHNAAILRREVGNYVAKIDPSFKELQNEYAHIVSYREELANVFHPYDGEAALKSGEKWLTQFGMGREGNLTYTDRKMLRFMEEGFQGKKIQMSGIGTDVSKQFQDLSNKIDTIKREIIQAKDPIFSKYAMEIADAGQAHMREMAALEAKGQLSKEELTLKTSHIKEVIAQAKNKALLDIETKKRIYESLKRRTSKLDETRKRIEGFASAFGFGMAGAGLFKASRVFRASLMARKAMRLRGRTK